MGSDFNDMNLEIFITTLRSITTPSEEFLRVTRARIFSLTTDEKSKITDPEKSRIPTQAVDSRTAALQ